MSEKNRVLAANSEFYRAFLNRDFDRMNEIWSKREDVTVIHPGHPLLHGRAKVLTSWRQILSSVHSPDIHCCNTTAYVSDSVAYVICNESLSTSTLIATNIFILENDSWKLIHHQAGPAPDLMDETPTGRPH